MSYLVLVRQGDKYGPEYTTMLRKMARETSGLDTLVLGDGIDADIRLEFNWPGWWSKLELLRPDLESIRPFVYVDLDSYILRDISPVLDDDWWIAREWWEPAPSKVQSSMMVIPKDASEIWDAWISHPMNWMQLWGDQAFFDRFQWNFIQDKFPDMIGSFKKHDTEAPKHRVVTFHGNKKYKPHNAKRGWVKEVWDKWN